ncbi:MAG: hypothetical protein WBB27_05680 [Maribacter sp.]|jgi:uncharacterized membrane protein
MKYLPLIVISLSFSFGFVSEILPIINIYPKQDSIQEEAFRVLQTKCNVCHASKKKVDIFTYQNMDSLALEINQQVFIKKKMPKGRKIKLTTGEQEQLKTWMASLLEQ